MKYAIKVPIDDGGWLYVTETKEDGICDIATYDTFEEAEEHAKLWRKGEVVECQYTEAERLRAKKQAIKEELYDKVKMEMFKASSALENIEYKGIEVQCKTHPDAPHGFDRDSSLSMNRYVCECEYWEPDWEPEELREITKEEYELFEKLKKIWLHSVPEKSGTYFICGEVGYRDAMGLPEKIMVCPTYGSDGFAVYTKTTDYSAPSY